MAHAAAAWLDSLEDDQRRAAAWPWPSDSERHLWFYTPTDHGGLAIGDMRPGQQRRAMQLVASGLSRAGYVTVSTIMGLDNVLDELEGWTMQWGRERGRDPGRYYVRVFGDPRDGGTWSWRFGGHHVSLNHTVVDGSVIGVTPCFLGADPASSPLLGPHPLRPLAGAEDLGRELVRSLDAGQLARAVISPVAPVDIAGANRSRLADGDGPLPLGDVWRGRFEGDLAARVDAIQRRAEEAAGLRPEHVDAVRLTTDGRGLAASALGAAQKAGLRALLDVYLRRVPDALADQEAAKYEGGAVDRLWFAWAGPVERGEPHYYRVQGPGLLVEYDNTQRGANHIHTVWRDPERDFGGDALAAHRLAHH
jgi:Protein of unknown function (DUF3500)